MLRLTVCHTRWRPLMQTHHFPQDHKIYLATAMAEKAQLAPPFRELTRLFLHNVRYHPEIVSRKNLDDFIVMVQDPVRLAQVYDQLASLRQDL